jgi:hypothetical protein
VDAVAYARAGIFGPGGIGFWVFLLILALLAISWVQGFGMRWDPD